MKQKKGKPVPHSMSRTFGEESYADIIAFVHKAVAVIWQRKGEMDKIIITVNIEDYASNEPVHYSLQEKGKKIVESGNPAKAVSDRNRQKSKLHNMELLPLAPSGIVQGKQRFSDSPDNTEGE